MYSTDINDTRPLPAELQSVLGTEKILFSVFGKRNAPAGTSIFLFCFGVVWSALIGGTAVTIFKDFITKSESHSAGNAASAVATGSGTMLPPFEILFLVPFILVGIGILSVSLYLFFKKGGYFVGTESGLLRYNKGTLHFYDWDQFLGNAEINGKKGTILLKLRTWKQKIINQKHGEPFVPETIYISGLPNALEIGKICMQKIREHTSAPIQNNPFL